MLGIRELLSQITKFGKGREMRQRTVNILGAIYVTTAFIVATFCPPPAYNRASPVKEPACTVGQETSRTDRDTERLYGPSGIPEIPEYVDGQPVKYYNPATLRQEKEASATTVTEAEDVNFPPNYLLIWKAEWCNKCPLMKEIGDKLKDEGFDVHYIDFDKNQKKARRDNIAGLPVAVIYTDGEEVKRVIGISEKSQKKQEKRIRAVLKKNKKESTNYVVY